MQGTAVIIPSGKSLPLSTMMFAEPPTLEFLRSVVGGHIEWIPGFDTLACRHLRQHGDERNPFRHGHGDIVRCVAFCTKEGKLDNLPFNGNATMLWQMALRRARPDDPSFFPDYLVGTVVVLFGDDEFMQAL